MIIPKPLSIEIRDREPSFLLNADTKIRDAGLADIAEDFNAFMERALGYRLATSEEGGIVFALDPSLEIELGDEGYLLEIARERIRIRAAEPNGVFYGVQSLKQIIVKHDAAESVSIPAMAAKDRPLYGYRGYMLDVSRHFFPIGDILKLIDVLALHKINALHLHLTDDQGWRLRIDRLPRLTTVGSHRKQTINDGRWHGGWYSREDIRRIVAYCARRYITVIPEIDMPGHSTAAIAAYPHLSCRGEPIEVAELFGIKADILCAGKESTYQFVYHVLDEVIGMFPGPYIHLGGDEALKDRWEECEHCQKRMEDKGLTGISQLQGYFLNEVIDYLKARGKKAICWNESLYSGMLDTSAVCQYWQDGKDVKRVKDALHKGRPVIVSKYDPYYLDYPFAMHTLRAVYTFTPELTGTGDDESILGVEAPLWTEYVCDLRRAEYMTFPRLGAVAEIGWSQKGHRDYDDFIKRLPVYLRLLDIYHVRYADLKDTNPGPLKKIRQMMDFAKRASLFSKANRKNNRESVRAHREMVRSREDA